MIHEYLVTIRYRMGGYFLQAKYLPAAQMRIQVTDQYSRPYYCREKLAICIGRYQNYINNHTPLKVAKYLILTILHTTNMISFQGWYPHKLCFKPTVSSRKIYRWRFLLSIAITFILTNLDFLLSCICWLVYLDSREINDQTPALRNGCFLILTTLASYPLGLLILWYFYKKCHIWKSKGVCVGYQLVEAYDEPTSDINPQDQVAIEQGTA